MMDTVRDVDKVKGKLPQFHTRRMKHEYMGRYSNLHAVNVPQHILRAIYADLTSDYSAAQNPALDARVQQAILEDDPDLRNENKGRPGDLSEPFLIWQQRWKNFLQQMKDVTTLNIFQSMR